MASAGRTSILPAPARTRPAEPGDQRVLLHGVRWEQYVALGAALGERAGVRMTYLDGTLEIMTLSRQHEHLKKLTARLVETYAEEQGLSLNGFGSETLRRKLKESGIEPDESYCIGPEKKVPDLAIEVVVTSGGIDKLEVYRRLGVSEVWFWIQGELRVHRLGARGYERRDRSDRLPGLDVAGLSAIVTATDRSHQTEAVRAFRRSLRRKRG